MGILTVKNWYFEGKKIWKLCQKHKTEHFVFQTNNQKVTRHGLPPEPSIEAVNVAQVWDIRLLTRMLMKSDTFLLFWAHVCFCTYLSFTDVFNSTFELYLPFFHELFPLSEQMNHITEIHELIQFPFFMVLSFVHLVLNHSPAYTVFCLHGCFSKVSKSSVSRGPLYHELHLSKILFCQYFFLVSYS